VRLPVKGIPKLVIVEAICSVPGMPLFARNCPDITFPSAAIVVAWILFQSTVIIFWYSRNTKATNTNPTITNRILTTFFIAYPIRKPVIPPKPAEVAVEVRELISTIFKRLNCLVYTNFGHFSYKDIIKETHFNFLGNTALICNLWATSEQLNIYELRVAIEPIHRVVLGIYTSRHRNMLVVESFLTIPNRDISHFFPGRRESHLKGIISY
jgi:hypothetical protein